jgi:hypothetical protein
VRIKAFGRNDAYSIQKNKHLLYFRGSSNCEAPNTAIGQLSNLLRIRHVPAHKVEPGTRYGNSLLGTFPQQLRKAITLIPVYNIMAYTERRLLSILNQLLKWYPKEESERLGKKGY